jgi:uridylate kinase
MPDSLDTYQNAAEIIVQLVYAVVVIAIVTGVGVLLRQLLRKHDTRADSSSDD